MPVIFRFGFADDLINQNNMKLTVAADLAHYNDVNEKVNFGLEYSIMNFILRGGYILNTDTDYAEELGWSSGLSFGAGVSVSPSSNLHLGIDYGFRDLARLGISHRAALTIGF